MRKLQVLSSTRRFVALNTFVVSFSYVPIKIKLTLFSLQINCNVGEIKEEPVDMSIKVEETFLYDENAYISAGVSFV